MFFRKKPSKDSRDPDPSRSKPSRHLGKPKRGKKPAEDLRQREEDEDDEEEEQGGELGAVTEQEPTPPSALRPLPLPLEPTVASLHSDNARLAATVRRQQAEIDSLNQRIAALQRPRGPTLPGSVASLRSEIARLEAELQQRDTVIRRLNERIAVLGRRLAYARDPESRHPETPEYLRPPAWAEEEVEPPPERLLPPVSPELLEFSEERIRQDRERGGREAWRRYAVEKEVR